jgi:S-formylglutathione hydrolase FrmB
MIKSADGKWRVAVDLAPGQWVYKFIVDGEWIADPSTADNDSDGRGGRHSFVFSGDGPWREHATIAHGKVETTMLPSAAWGKTMKVNVYLPPGFSKSRSYPVLLLLHGAGMDADQWYRTGQIQNYMDNLIADHSILPFVVVMPSSADLFYIEQSDTHITQELPRWLKSRYGQTLEARHSATAGMSMGGFGAVILPLNHPQLFGFGYALSAYFPPEQVAKMVIPRPLPFGLVMFTGDHDRVTESAPPFLDKLNQGRAQYSYHVDAGAHTWNYFSLHSADMLRAVSRHFSSAGTSGPGASP